MLHIDKWKIYKFVNFFYMTIEMMSPIEMQEKACRNRRNGDGNKKNNIIILSLDKNIF